MSRELTQTNFDAAFVGWKVSSADLADCLIIQSAAQQLGIRMTLYQAQDVWEYHSNMRDAQWLTVRPEEVVEALQEYIDAALSTP